MSRATKRRRLHGLLVAIASVVKTESRKVYNGRPLWAPFSVCAYKHQALVQNVFKNAILNFKIL